MGQTESEILLSRNYISTAQMSPEKYSPGAYGNWQSINSGYVRHSSYIPSNPCTPCARLNSRPELSPLYFPCPSCKRRLYDGGLNKLAACLCGKQYIRNDEGPSIEKSGDGTPGFNRIFEEINNVPDVNYIPELVSITLGMFREGIAHEFIAQGHPNFPRTFTLLLAPFLLKKLRCLGIGEYFQYGDGRFKVLGAYPSYGIITDQTVIYCPTLLSTSPLTALTLGVIGASGLTECPSHLSGHFHTGQHLYINGTEFLVSSVDPMDGLLTAHTEIHIEQSNLTYLTHAYLLPYLEDLPFQYQFLSKTEFTAEIFNLFIGPYFQGFKRILQKDQQITIAGITFKVTECWPETGVCSESTVLLYSGGYVRRDIERLREAFGSSIEISESLMMREEGFFRNFFVAGHVEAPGADEETIHTFPTHVIVNIPSDPNVATCVICMSPYQIGEESKTLPCFHMFHSSCIDEWLTDKSMCPVCKTSITVG